MSMHEQLEIEMCLIEYMMITISRCIHKSLIRVHCVLTQAAKAVISLGWCTGLDRVAHIFTV